MKFLDYGIPLKDFELFRDDSGTKRYYVSPEGERYMSVTSFLSLFSDNTELEKWREAVGEVEADRVSKQATTKGTAIHLACENLLKNLEKPDSHLSMFDAFDFKCMKNYLEANVNRIFGIEHQMVSKKLKLAGTVDLIAEHRNKLAIIDFKTASRVKYKEEIYSYFLQAAAYAVMLFENYGLQAEELTILICVDKDVKLHVYTEPVGKWIRKLLELRKSTLC